jgi:hypothetical protein
MPNPLYSATSLRTPKESMGVKNPGPAVAPYFEVCAPVSLGVSPHFVKSQNMGSPPIHTIDAALRNGAWPRHQRA